VIPHLDAGVHLAYTGATPDSTSDRNPDDEHSYDASVAVRRYIFPQAGDDLATIAARELAGVEGAEQQLLSWNLHLAARSGLGRSGGLLPSDVVFTEPPPAR
jgi:hypothetical protein